MKSPLNLTPNQIDELLPQTQCGLCGYGGCMPYAEAIAYKNEAINLCPPGGITTLLKLATLTNQDAGPYINEMTQKAKARSVTAIRESECIGCTKCIQACPVDAIVGAAKQMHTVLTDVCTGCDLCLPPCPVDCIDVVPVQEPNELTKKQKSDIARERFNNRKKRLGQIKPSIDESELELSNELQRSIETRQADIKAALARVRQKKSK